MAVLSGRYELGRRIGTGGMGEVFEAHDRKLGRRVAVKLMLPGLGDPHARARFVREVQLAAAFTHPNVVTVFDVGEDDGRPYFVMEVVDGRTLHEALAAGPLPVDETLRIADAVLAGLAAAHALGLVHRDVKPANVLLGRDGAVKLTDFGIAKATQDAAALTATGQALGTPAYLSPEQASGEPTGPATDVYATGVVLYEMLAGAPPFKGDSPIATVVQHRQAPVPPLADRRPEVPPAVVAAVERALEKDPSRRFADAEEMRDALDRAARDRAGAADTTVANLTSVLPAPTAAAAVAGRAKRTRRRRRLAPAALVGLVLGALLVAGAFALGTGDDDSGGGGSRGAASEPTSTSTSTSTSTTTTTIPTPRDLGALAAVLAGNPSAYGPRGPELLDGILEILDGNDEDGRTARKLFDEIPKWTARGELAPEIGGLAEQFLVPYLEGTGDEDDDGKGPGKDKRFDVRDLLPGNRNGQD